MKQATVGTSPLVLERTVALTLDQDMLAAPEATVFRAMIRAGASDARHAASVLVDADHQCPYGDIISRLEAIQQMLLEHGLQPGDCVTAELTNSLCSALIILALLDGGYSVMVTKKPESRAGTAEPPPVRFTKAFVSVRTDLAPTSQVLSLPATYLEVRANAAFNPAAPAPHPDHPRVYSRTSGSLGIAKIVVRPFERYRLNVLNMATRIRLSSSMRMALPTPICHLFGLGAGLLLGIHRGVSIDLQDRANALRFFEREIEFQPDVAVIIPTFCETLIRMRRKPRPYRFMIIGGDTTSDAARRKSEALHGPLLNAYGSSEMGFIAIPDIDSPEQMRNAAAGRLMPGVSVRLLLEPSQVNETSPAGVLQLKTAFRFEGYVDSEGNRVEPPAAFDGEWFHTGDLARLSPDNTLHVLGRSDLSVNRNGLLLPFADVETRLREIEGVDEAVVIAGSHGIRGRALVAFCVVDRASALSAAEVRDRYAALAPPYAVPDDVHIVDSFPKLASGKVDRRALESRISGAPAH